MNVQPGDNNAVDGYTNELRLITKAIGFLAFVTGLLYLRVIVGAGLASFNSGELPIGVALVFAFLLIATAGLLLSWHWEGLGGFLSLLGGLGLALMDYEVLGRKGWIAAFLYSSPFIISGTLCLLCWRQDRRQPQS
jgi:hypothetical protein